MLIVKEVGYSRQKTSSRQSIEGIEYCSRQSIKEIRYQGGRNSILNSNRDNKRFGFFSFEILLL